MKAITYLKGDATSPQASGIKIIAHVCNDIGGWGKGFVLAISRRWPEPEKAYREWHCFRTSNDFKLGSIQLVKVSCRGRNSNCQCTHAPYRLWPSRR